jgi:hypothetical protein
MENALRFTDISRHTVPRVRGQLISAADCVLVSLWMIQFSSVNCNMRSYATRLYTSNETMFTNNECFVWILNQRL